MLTEITAMQVTQLDDMKKQPRNALNWMNDCVHWGGAVQDRISYMKFICMAAWWFGTHGFRVK